MRTATIAAARVPALRATRSNARVRFLFRFSSKRDDLNPFEGELHLCNTRASESRRCSIDLKEVRLERRRVLSLKSYKNVGDLVIRYIVVF